MIWSLLLLAVAVFVAFNLFLMYNERYQHKTAWKVPCSHAEMVAMAKQKKDFEMNDEEFNIKYAAFRHEAFRLSLISKGLLHVLNRVFHWIEVYVLYGGPQRLQSKYKIHAPIFIIGDFRSGTSVLERLISHHPDVCYFNMAHQVIWSGPYLWNLALNYMGFIRETLFGHRAWNKPGGKGIFFPHSSNVLLTRDRPFEIENLWEFCSKNLTTNRCDQWDILDDPEKNADNRLNADLLDSNYSDKAFEELLLNSIRLIVAHHMSKGSKKPRFILKNPLNGFRLGFIRKLFPDARFIHIARNPLKTTLSQIRLARGNLRAVFLDEMQCRRNNNLPPKQEGRNSWNFLMNGKYPNQEWGTLWIPRQFPRTVPEYQQITRYIKEDKYEVAVAVAVTQQERVTLEGFQAIKAEQGKDVLTIWHEDILSDATKSLELILDFLELPCTPEQRLAWLELEDFPGGQANAGRVKKSNRHEKSINFGKWTKEVTEIIQGNDVWKRYKERVRIEQRGKPQM